MHFLQTIKENIYRFRVEDDISYYCLSHRIQSEYYHNIHVNQLETLYNITGDPAFSLWSSLLKKDHQ